MDKIVSEAVIKRLPRYYRYIKELSKKGVIKVSSGKLAVMMELTASQVRQDFCNFGEFGQQGYGYDVEKLKAELSTILGLKKGYKVVIIGAGNIGKALSRYEGFTREGFEIIALFDSVVSLGNIDGIPLLNANKLEGFLKTNKIDIGVIATPASCADEICEILVSGGVKNIWNFAPVDLKCDSNVVVENIFMSDSLYVLSYKMNH